jgi:hypothetical protein
MSQKSVIVIVNIAHKKTQNIRSKNLLFDINAVL